MDHLYLRTQFDGPPVALGRHLFRKQLLKYGEWAHPAAPNGVLRVTKEFVEKIASNFRKGVRDDVPVPLGHDVDAISSVGHVIALEVDDKELWGIHEIDEAAAEKIGKLWTGTSAFIDLNAVDKQTGEELGPVLVHNAITNAPYIKGLAPFEAVALGEAAEGAVVISLQDGKTNEPGGAMTLEELLQELQETSDDDLRTALAKARPALFEKDSKDDADAAIAAARQEEREAVVAALAEKGITVALSEGKPGTAPKAEADIKSAPEYVALSERVTALEKDKAEAEADAVINKAVDEGKVLPAQVDALKEIALSDAKGLDRVKRLIPEKPLVDLSEKGVAPSGATNVVLEGKEAEAEADRLVAAYGSGSKEGK